MLRAKGLNQSLLQQTLHNLRRVCGCQAVIPSSLVISGGLQKSDHKPFGVDRCSDVWVARLNRHDVHVKVVGFEEKQKVGKSPGPDPKPGSIDVP